MIEGDVKWGILGAGTIANIFAVDIKGAAHARAFAIGSRDRQKGEAFAQKHGVERVYDSYAGLVADPDIDIIYVATPSPMHLEHAMLALRQGKHVLVEKPFAMDAREAETIFAEARSRGLLAMHGMWTLCHPLIGTLAKRMREGVIGDPVGFICNGGPLGVTFSRGSGLRYEDPALGGSFLLECHVYPISILSAIVPELAQVERVLAAASFSDRHKDEVTSMILQTADGRISTISGGIAYTTATSPDTRVHIIGTSGWMEISDSLYNPSRAAIGTAEGTEVIELDNANRGLAWEIEEASRVVREGRSESALVPTALTLNVMRIMDRVREAAGITLGR